MPGEFIIIQKSVNRMKNRIVLNKSNVLTGRWEGKKNTFRQKLFFLYTS